MKLLGEGGKLGGKGIAEALEGDLRRLKGVSRTRPSAACDLQLFDDLLCLGSVIF
jgi:hypothetical protein